MLNHTRTYVWNPKALRCDVNDGARGQIMPGNLLNTSHIRCSGESGLPEPDALNPLFTFKFISLKRGRNAKSHQHPSD